MRRGLVAGAVVLLLIIVVAVVLLARGGGPADRLVAFAPPDALAWAHGSTREKDSTFWRLAARFPVLRDAPARLAGSFGLGASRFDLRRDVRPWLGDEAGIALLPDGAPLLLADVADRAKAEAALRRLGATRAGDLLRLPAPGKAAGLGEDLLAVGPEAAVRAALARARNGREGLDGTAPYERATADREGDRVLDAYAPAAGVRSLLESSDPVVRATAAVVNGPALAAVGAEVAPDEDGARVRARVTRTGAAAEPATFAPGLLGRVPEQGTIALVDVPGAGALTALAQRLGASALLEGARRAVAEAGADLDSDVLAPLRGETALSLQGRGNVPVFTLLARSADPDATQEALARLQAPLADGLTGGASSVFETREGGGFTLPLTPQLQPSYAVDGDVLVASTAQPGLDQTHVAARGIARSPTFGRALARTDGRVQALGFIDLQELLLLGERTGLSAGPGLRALRADLEPLDAVGAIVSPEDDHPTDTTAELFLQIP